MKFMHSADWQLGTRLTVWRESRAKLRKVRLQTLEEAPKKPMNPLSMPFSSRVTFFSGQPSGRYLWVEAALSRFCQAFQLAGPHLHSAG